MNNSIDGISGGGLTPDNSGKIKETTGKTDKDVNSTKADTQSGQAGSGDQVVLTDSAKRLQAIERQLQEVPVVDSAKVENIRQRIADGSFQIDANSVAEKLLSTDELIV